MPSTQFHIDAVAPAVTAQAVASASAALARMAYAARKCAWVLSARTRTGSTREKVR